MWLGTRLECVGSLPRVSGACQDGAREFAERRPRLAERLSGVTENLTESWEGLDDAMRAHREFDEGIGKIARNTLGDRKRKTVILAVGNAIGYQIAGVRSLIKFGCHVWL
ncbi:hypothetical protein GW17_00056979 [Ensete ventricosum]|nr:hypothetical protein GW17_00056979 [Ensete ventricosum]